MRRKASPHRRSAKSPPRDPIEIIPLFRAWLEHTMRMDVDDRLSRDRAATLHGLGLCLLMLDEKPEALSKVWSRPIINAVGTLGDALRLLEVFLEKHDLTPTARERCTALSEKLDFALCLVHREVSAEVRWRSHRTHCIDLLVDALVMLEGDGTEAAAVIERIQKDHPEVDRLLDGSLDRENAIDSFAWETYERVAALDRLVEKYPEHAKWAARQMHAWPMLRSRHHADEARFRALAEKLELGRDYPLDASEAAQFRPDTPMVRLLDPLLFRLCRVRELGIGWGGAKALTVRSLTGHWWNHWDEEPREAELRILRRLPKLPSLTKKSAKRWATRVVVPMIMETMSVRREECTEIVFRNIWQHRSVKSLPTFRSRLEAAVIAYLRRMSRPK
jgi:hypothetical protein